VDVPCPPPTPPHATRCRLLTGRFMHERASVLLANANIRDHAAHLRAAHGDDAAGQSTLATGMVGVGVVLAPIDVDLMAAATASTLPAVATARRGSQSDSAALMGVLARSGRRRGSVLAATIPVTGGELPPPPIISDEDITAPPAAGAVDGPAMGAGRRSSLITSVPPLRLTEVVTGRRPSVFVPPQDDADVRGADDMHPTSAEVALSNTVTGGRRRSTSPSGMRRSSITTGDLSAPSVRYRDATVTALRRLSTQVDPASMLALTSAVVVAADDGGVVPADALLPPLAPLVAKPASPVPGRRSSISHPLDEAHLRGGVKLRGAVRAIMLGSAISSQAPIPSAHPSDLRMASVKRASIPPADADDTGAHGAKPGGVFTAPAVTALRIKVSSSSSSSSSASRADSPTSKAAAMVALLHPQPLWQGGRLRYREWAPLIEVRRLPRVLAARVRAGKRYQEELRVGASEGDAELLRMAGGLLHTVSFSYSSARDTWRSRDGDEADDVDDADAGGGTASSTARALSAAGSVAASDLYSRRWEQYRPVLPPILGGREGVGGCSIKATPHPTGMLTLSPAAPLPAAKGDDDGAPVHTTVDPTTSPPPPRLTTMSLWPLSLLMERAEELVSAAAAAAAARHGEVSRGAAPELRPQLLRADYQQTSATLTAARHEMTVLQARLSDMMAAASSHAADASASATPAPSSRGGAALPPNKRGGGKDKVVPVDPAIAAPASARGERSSAAAAMAVQRAVQMMKQRRTVLQQRIDACREQLEDITALAAAERVDLTEW